MMTNDDDLRTALTKLADKWDAYAGTGRVCARQLRALLAAHPAPAPASDPTGHEFIGVAGHPDDDECTYRADGTDATYCGARKESHAPAPVSDTRREDVARALFIADADGQSEALLREVWDRAPSNSAPRLYWYRLADSVLAVLPAPPVVDEEQILDCMTNTWAAHIGVGDPVTPLPVHRHMAAAVAARLRRATRGARLDKVDTRPVADLAATICDGNTEHLRAWPLIAESAYCGQCHSAAERVLAALPAPPVSEDVAVAELVPGDQIQVFDTGGYCTVRSTEPVGLSPEMKVTLSDGMHITLPSAARVSRVPAPPVVDEAEVRDLILKVDDEGGWSNVFPDEATALAAEIVARLRGANR